MARSCVIWSLGRFGYRQIECAVRLGKNTRALALLFAKLFWLEIVYTPIGPGGAAA